jgi:hypothetical protein
MIGAQQLVVLFYQKASKKDKNRNKNNFLK